MQTKEIARTTIETAMMGAIKTETRILVNPFTNKTEMQSADQC